MNAIEERVYTLADDTISLASDLYNSLTAIRYDPTGAAPDDLELMKEIRGLLNQAVERAKMIQSSIGS